MAGSRQGVARQILDEESRALFTHCYGHSLNLAMCDTLKNCKLARDALDTAYEISKLIKFSPKRNHMFDELKKQLSPDTPGFRVLCPTRWTVRAESLKSILNNYKVLQDLWDTALETGLDAEVRSRVTGVKAQMEKFSFFFGVYIGELVLGHGDNLSKTLQSKVISAAEAQKVAKLTVTTLTKIRDSKHYELFWKLVVQRASTFNVSEPALPRKRKAPSRYETGTEDSHFHVKLKTTSVKYILKSWTWQLAPYKQGLTLQPGFRTFQMTKSLLMKGERYVQ